MPNPKAGTVTMDIGKAVSDVKAGKIDFKVDKYGIVHVAVGKTSFSKENIIDNVQEMISTLVKMKPSASKGTYIKSIALSGTMTPSVRIDVKPFS
jgi:large subunit ribosomal protein L1